MTSYCLVLSLWISPLLSLFPSPPFIHAHPLSMPTSSRWLWRILEVFSSAVPADYPLSSIQYRPVRYTSHYSGERGYMIVRSIIVLLLLMSSGLTPRCLSHLFNLAHLPITSSDFCFFFLSSLSSLSSLVIIPSLVWSWFQRWWRVQIGEFCCRLWYRSIQTCPNDGPSDHLVSGISLAFTPFVLLLAWLFCLVIISIRCQISYALYCAYRQAQAY